MTYTEAFFHYLRTGEETEALAAGWTEDGYLLPFELDPIAILRGRPENPFT